MVLFCVCYFLSRVTLGVMIEHLKGTEVCWGLGTRVGPQVNFLTLGLLKERSRGARPEAQTLSVSWGRAQQEAIPLPTLPLSAHPSHSTECFKYLGFGVT